jgi:hypothetical protein
MAATPDPLTVNSGTNVLSINIPNNAAVDTSLLAPATAETVVIVFRGPFGTERVLNTGNPNFNPTSAVFKFIREDVLCAAYRALGPAAIENHDALILPVEGTFPSTGGGLYGNPAVVLNGTFDTSVCQ